MTGTVLFGLCSAISESGVQMTIPKMLFGNRWPGEVDLGLNWDVVGERLALERCSLPMARLYWEDPERGKSVALEDDVGLTALPYYRSSAFIREYFPSPYVDEWQKRARAWR